MVIFRIKHVGLRIQLVALALLMFCNCASIETLVAQDRMPSTSYEAIVWLESVSNDVIKNDDGEVTEVFIDYVPSVFVVGDLDVFPKLETLKINYTGQFHDRHMSGIARLKSLKVFEANYCEQLSEASISVLRYLPNLEEVALTRCHAIFSLKSLAECRNLKKIDLKRNDHLDFETLKNLRQLPKLESLDLGYNENLEDQHLRWLKGIKSLKELSLVGCTALTDDVFEQLGEIPNLKKLVIQRNKHITGASIGNLDNGMLEELKLVKCGLNDESLAKFKHLGSLRKFNFSGNENIKGPGLAVLANFKRLEQLNLSGLGVNNDQLKSLNGISTLKAIDLSDSPRVSGIGLAALTKSKSLEKLNLGGCRRIDSEDLIEIAKFSKLKVLGLAGTKIKSHGLDQLKQLNSLQELDLSKCNWIDDSAILKLVEFPALQKIQLGKVQRLTDLALEHLAKSKTLKEIQIKDNRNITGDGLASFAGNQMLVRLELFDLTKLSAKGLGYLKGFEALEDLSITIDDEIWTREHLKATHGLPKVKTVQFSGISELEDGLYKEMTNSLPMYSAPYEDEYFEDDDD